MSVWLYVLDEFLNLPLRNFFDPTIDNSDRLLGLEVNSGQLSVEVLPDQRLEVSLESEVLSHPEVVAVADGLPAVVILQEVPVLALYQLLAEETSQRSLELLLAATVVCGAEVEDGQGRVETERGENKVFVLKTGRKVAVALLSEVLQGRSQ